MKKAIAITVLALLIVYIGGSWYFSGLIINGARRGYDEARERERLIEAGLTDMPDREDVRIETEGATLAGSYYDNPDEGNCAVILLHGRGGTRVNTTQFAPIFWEKDCDILAYDIRGSGESSISYQTFGYYDKYDASVAVDWLSERTGLSPSQIGFLGGSYGAAVSLQMLMVRSDIGFVIADSTFSSLPSIVVEQGSRQFGSWVQLFTPVAFFLAGLRADFDPYQVSPEDAVANTDVPVLLIHGLADEATVVSNSEAVYANSNQGTTVLEITDWGPGHARSVRHNYQGYAALVYSFLDTYVESFRQ